MSCTVCEKKHAMLIAVSHDGVVDVNANVKLPLSNEVLSFCSYSCEHCRWISHQLVWSSSICSLSRSCIWMSSSSGWTSSSWWACWNPWPGKGSLGGPPPGGSPWSGPIALQMATSSGSIMWPVARSITPKYGCCIYCSLWFWMALGYMCWKCEFPLLP